MSTSVSSVVSHFPSAENGFTTTLASTVSAGATTVPLNSVAGFTNGEIVVFVVDPSNESKKQTFTGTIDTSGVQVTSVVWTAGTNVDHTAGATVVDYASATHISMMTKGILVHANQDGTLKTSTVQDALGVTTLPSGGWDVLNSGTAPTVGTGATLGNRSFDLTFASVDLSSTLSPGMRIKLDRNTTPSTQCADFESSSSQYASKSSPTGITFTDDFTCEAWVKLESYVQGGIVTRRDSSTAGWSLALGDSGQIIIGSLRIASNNRFVTSYQSIPLGKWVHIAATMNNSTNTHTIYIDGVSVPFSVSTNGTITALVQAGDVAIGRRDASGYYFDGEISDVRVWSAIRTQTEIQDNMYQALVGNETGLVGYWKLNGDFTDETSNSNDLTASGGVVATTADNPFNATEYGVITSVSYSTNTTVNVFCPEGYGIPNETLTNPFYSTQSVPFGFPKDKPFALYTLGASDQTLGSGYGSLTYTIVLSPGTWELYFSAYCSISAASNLTQGWDIGLSTSTSDLTHVGLQSRTLHLVESYAATGGLTKTVTMNSTATDFVTVDSTTTFTLVGRRVGTVSATLAATTIPATIRARKVI